MDEMFVFSQTFEGLYLRALGPEMNALCKRQLKEIGVDLEKPLLPAYAFDVWMKSIAVAAQALFPELPQTEARNLLGQKLVGGYDQTMIGRAMLSMLKVLGPRRTLERAAHNFRTGNNFTVTRLSRISDRTMDLWMNEVGPYPEFSQGIIQAGIVKSGAKEPVVEVTGYDGHGATYRVSWAA
jgi:uncharacterized protein (TIGR02265 family)